MKRFSRLVVSSLVVSAIAYGCGSSETQSHPGAAGKGAEPVNSAGPGGDSGAPEGKLGDAGHGGETEPGTTTTAEGGAAGSGGAGGSATAGAAASDAGAAGAAGAGGAAECYVAGIGDAATAKSCAELLEADDTLRNGSYQLDLDGTGPFPSLPYYCDMTGGGWTLVANQVAGAPLPDDQCTVEPSHFGSEGKSYRIGMPVVAQIRPTLAWKLTDATNTVYFKPACVVDWSVNHDTPSASADVCTTGYTTTAFTMIKNGGWKRASVRGIGINNYAADCSIRIYESHMDTDGMIESTSIAAGLAAPCVYQNYASERVSLWFR